MTDIEPSPFDDGDWFNDDGSLYPWGPQADETGLAYHYFSVFLRLGPGRTIAAAAREAGRSRDFFRELSPRYSWVDRAQAFDMHVERRATEELVRGRVKMREQHLEIAELAKAKIVARLKNLDPDEMSVRDLATWADLAVKIERQSRGEADKTLEVRGQIDVVDQLSTQERRALMEQARRVLNSRLGVKEIEADDGIIDAEEVPDGGQEG